MQIFSIERVSPVFEWVLVYSGNMGQGLVLVLVVGLHRHCTVFGKVLKSIVTVFEGSLRPLVSKNYIIFCDWNKKQEPYWHREYSCIMSSLSHAAQVSTTVFLNLLGREAQDLRGKAKDRSAQSLNLSSKALWQFCRTGMGTQRSILPCKLQCSGTKLLLHSSATALPPCTPPAPDIPLHPRASLPEQCSPLLWHLGTWW